MNLRTLLYWLAVLSTRGANAIAGQQLAKYTDRGSGPQAVVNGIMYSDDDSNGGRILSFDIASNVVVRIFPLPVAGVDIRAITTNWISGNLYLYAGTTEGRSYCWRVSDGVLMATFSGHAGPIRDIIATGSYFFSAAEDWKIKMYESLTGNPVLDFPNVHANYITSMSTDGTFLYSVSGDGKLVKWRISDRSHTQVIVGTAWLTKIAFDNGIVIASSDTGVSRVYTASTLSFNCQMFYHTGGVWSSSISGGQFYAGYYDGQLEQWRISDCTFVRTMNGHNGQPVHMITSQVGFLYSGSFVDATSIIWDTPESCPANSICDYMGYRCKSGYGLVSPLLCSPCAAGYYKSSVGNSACTSCAAGSFSGAGASSCSQCSAGTFSGIGASTCPACSAGSTSGPGASSCTECAAGSYESARTSCIPCASGYISIQGSSSCTACGPGTYKMSSSTCSSCPTGRISTGSANSICTLCEAGTFARNGIACDVCPIGTFANGPANSCTNCPIGQFNNATKSTGCTQCQSGTFKAAAGVGSCLYCNAGESSNLGSGSCFKCPAGSFKQNSGAGTCRNCGSGQFSIGTGNIACTNCPSGTFQPLQGANSCLSCSLGSSYQPAEGSSTCLDCPANSECLTKVGYTCFSGFIDKGNGNCTSCPSGQFFANETCQTCPAFARCNATHYVCNQPYKETLDNRCEIPGCPPGKTLSANGTCTNCEVGTSKSEIGDTFCTPCASGTYQNEAGKTLCKPCPSNALLCSSSAAICPQDHSLLNGSCKRSNLKPEPSISDINHGLASNVMIYAIGVACVILIISFSIYMRQKISSRQTSFKSTVSIAEYDFASTSTKDVAPSDRTFFSTTSDATPTTGATTFAEAALSIPGYLQVTDVDFIEEKFISKGGFGSVHLAKATLESLRTYGDRVVIKKMSAKKPTKSHADAFHQELAIMCFLRNSKYIAKLLGYVEMPMIIIMKYYSGGSLLDWLMNGKIKSKQMQLSFIEDIANGLFVIHVAGLAHCDIKPGNVLIETNLNTGRYQCVITDFGITQIVEISMSVVSEFQVSSINAASVAYASPEVLKHMRNVMRPAKFSLKAADIFSFSVLGMEILMRSRAWRS
eukprot:Partr_v1_DN28524_c1_g1_i2_m73000 putative Inherit from NOG: VSP with INR